MHFRWFENSVIEIVKAVSNSLMFNHLKWNWPKHYILVWLIQALVRHKIFLLTIYPNYLVTGKNQTGIRSSMIYPKDWSEILDRLVGPELYLCPVARTVSSRTSFDFENLAYKSERWYSVRFRYSTLSSVLGLARNL